MTEKPKKTRGGSKLSRSEVTTVRLDPKLRYLAELAARKQRRTLSSFIEWAVQESLERIPLREGVDHPPNIGSEAEYLWDVDAADRLVRLAMRYPELLTHEEQLLWKLIRENGYFWRGRFADGGHGRWRWSILEETLMLDRVREFWPTLLSVASGGLGADSMPKWYIDEADQVIAGYDMKNWNVLE